MIALVLFIVFMALWLITSFGDIPAPYSRPAGLLPWLSVLCLFLYIRHVF